MKNKIHWIILILSSIGFFTFGSLTKFTKWYDLGVALGFLIGVCQMLILFSLTKILNNKKKDD